MITDEGTITDPNSIFEEESSFYSSLYRASTHKINLDNCVFLHNSNIPSILEEARAYCDNPITISECHKALENMSCKKTPGSDGFSVEFYQFFGDYWPIVINMLLSLDHYH